MLIALLSLGRHARFGSLLRALVIHGMQSDRCRRVSHSKTSLGHTTISQGE